jgi:hypothetical protein
MRTPENCELTLKLANGDAINPIWISKTNKLSMKSLELIGSNLLDASQVGLTQYVSLSHGSRDTNSFRASTAKIYSAKGEVGIVT